MQIKKNKCSNLPKSVIPKILSATFLPHCSFTCLQLKTAVAHICKRDKQFLRHNTIFSKHKSIFVKQNTTLSKHNKNLSKHSTKVLKHNRKWSEHYTKLLKHNTGKPRHESIKKRPVSNMAIMSTAPVLVKESRIPEAILSFSGSLERGSVACEAVC